MTDSKKNNGIKNINENKRNSKNGFYLAIGIALGVVFGLLIDNLAIGIAVGVASGTSIDAIIAKENKKRQ